MNRACFASVIGAGLSARTAVWDGHDGRSLFGILETRGGIGVRSAVRGARKTRPRTEGPLARHSPPSSLPPLPRKSVQRILRMADARRFGGPGARPDGRRESMKKRTRRRGRRVFNVEDPSRDGENPALERRTGEHSAARRFLRPLARGNSERGQGGGILRGYRVFTASDAGVGRPRAVSLRAAAATEARMAPEHRPAVPGSVGSLPAKEFPGAPASRRRMRGAHGNKRAPARYRRFRGYGKCGPGDCPGVSDARRRSSGFAFSPGGDGRRRQRRGQRGRSRTLRIRRGRLRRCARSAAAFGAVEPRRYGSACVRVG